jgi:hypothetical protein
MCSCQFSFCFSIFSVKLNIFNSKRMSVLRFWSRRVYPAAERKDFFSADSYFLFVWSIYLSNFRLHKSAWALPLFYKIVAVCFVMWVVYNNDGKVPVIIWCHSAFHLSGKSKYVQQYLVSRQSTGEDIRKETYILPNLVRFAQNAWEWEYFCLRSTATN